MTGSMRIVAVTVVGAVAGSIAGYLFFTEEGRALRRRLEPALEEMTAELDGLKGTVVKAVGVANEGWRLLTETLDEGQPYPPRYSGARQTSPF